MPNTSLVLDTTILEPGIGSIDTVPSTWYRPTLAKSSSYSN